MEIINNPTYDEIKKAAKALKDGHLVAFPTETVYGLGADATNEKAISRIYSVKGRPTDHPLIVHISSINQLDKWAIDIPNYAVKLAKDFWPGPMTLILKRSELAKNFVTGGQNNVGLRVPDQPVAFGLLSEFEKLGGIGIGAPSANRFRAVSPTTSIATREEIGNYLTPEDLILDGGNCHIGVESTIIDCTSNFPSILRPGAISLEMIEEVLNLRVNRIDLENRIKVSGNLSTHYSPKAEVLLDQLPEPNDGFFAMADIQTPSGSIRLGSPKNVEDFARDIYSALRMADIKNIKRIAVLSPSGTGLAVAIRDRLAKAAGKK